MLNNINQLNILKRKEIIILSSTLIVFLSFLINNVISNSFQDKYIKDNTYKIEEYNRHNTEKLYNSTNIEINSNSLNSFSYKKNKDLNYILNYKGGNLEPEWEWVKNISVVYTWVDGSEIEFLNLKSKYNGGIKKINSRDRSADELRYSLRSLEKYMPWHNGTIFIVTSQQIPKWLDLNNSRIKIIYHKDIFPKHTYPTYDSNTIEMYFDKIPGITERFLYFNDDVFLNNYIHPCFFFTSETFYPKVYRNIIRKIDEKEVERIVKFNDIHEIFQASKYYTRQTIREYFDNQFEFRDLFHTVHVFYRDLFEPYRQLFSKELRSVSANRFRHPTKVQTIYLYQAFMQYATQHKDFPLKLGGDGKAKNFQGYKLPENRTINKYSCEIISPNIGNQFIKYGKITDNSKKNNKYFDLFRNSPNIYIYNLNDAYSENRSLYEFTEYMITRYPKPTSFEKEKYISLEKSIPLKMKSIDKNLETIIDSINNDFKNKHIKALKIMINKYKLNIIKDYLDKKRELAYPKTKKIVISSKEKNELYTLLSYHGEELLDEWKWVENVSFVYYLEKPKSKYTFKFPFFNHSISKNDTEIEEMSSINELKYSLRSLEKYLPWHKGNIFIIPEDQNIIKDSWLNVNNNKIRIIDKDQIIPKEYPISKNNNKHTIEMFLDKIPNISEQFIYIQPHHFFRNYTHPCFFFNKEYNEFFPKYNFKNSQPIDEINHISKTSIGYTYKVIVKYFGNNYIKSYREFEDLPIPLYRDLFEPTRKLFQDSINESFKHNRIKSKKIDLLPLYLVTNYNIYGTSQPFYPDYLVGYGKVQEIKLPIILNENRTIDFYGFDITSKNIDKYTILSKSLTENQKTNYKIMKKILYTNKLFFSLKIENKERLTINNKINLYKLMNYLYSNSSSFEISNQK